MLSVYPLKPVITDDLSWKSVYDRHPDSVGLTSACITPGEAQRLLAEGATFEAVLLLDDAGEELAEKLAPVPGEHPDMAPRIERLKLKERNADSVALIHDYLRDKPQSAFFQTAGG
jgi:hypothetical protein